MEDNIEVNSKTEAQVAAEEYAENAPIGHIICEFSGGYDLIRKELFDAYKTGWKAHEAKGNWTDTDIIHALISGYVREQINKGILDATKWLTDYKKAKQEQ